MAIDNAYWRDPVLGEPHTLELPGGPLRAFDTGSGAPIVFVHGLLVNANLWRKVVSRLAPDFRCIALDMPLGSHQVPLPAAAPRGAPAAAAMVADALDALDLDGATLVGNDTGGAISQIAVTTRPERAGRLVLSSCVYRDNFPPKMFSYFKLAAAVQEFPAPDLKIDVLDRDETLELLGEISSFEDVIVVHSIHARQKYTPTFVGIGHPRIGGKATQFVAETTTRKSRGSRNSASFKSVCIVILPSPAWSAFKRR